MMPKQTKRKRRVDVRWIRKNKNGEFGTVAHKKIPHAVWYGAGVTYVKVKLVEVK